MKIVVTLPAYNEEKTISLVIRDIKNQLKSYNYKIVVVDDGSKDRTSQIAKKEGAIVFKNRRNIGLAGTFKAEMKESLKLNPDVIVHTDADGQYPAKYIPKLIALVEDGYDLVLGSRFNIGKYRGSISKKIGNIAFARVFTSLLNQKVTDTTTGLRAFTKEVAELPIINSFTYTQEQLIRAGKMNMNITEIPINTMKTRPSRLFSNSMDYAIKAWINILRIYRDYQPLRFFGLISLFFIFIGSILGFYIVYEIVTYGKAGGIPRIIFSMLSILVGVQIGLFGFLADMKRT